MGGNVARVDDELTTSARQFRRPPSGRVSRSQRIRGGRQGGGLHHAKLSQARPRASDRGREEARDGMTAPSVKPAATAQTGVWVGIAAIAMSFAAYSSALVVRQSASPDWRHFDLPRILFFNTFIVLASSATLYAARPRSRSTVDRSGALTAIDAPHLTCLYLTTALGLLFLAGLIAAWRNLVDQGITLASNPSSSFFYLLMSMPGL